MAFPQAAAHNQNRGTNILTYLTFSLILNVLFLSNPVLDLYEHYVQSINSVLDLYEQYVHDFGNIFDRHTPLVS